jgi:hypothetical protein
MRPEPGLAANTLAWRIYVGRPDLDLLTNKLAWRFLSRRPEPYRTAVTWASRI